MAGAIYSFLVAMDQNRLIGSQGTLPWHLPADLKYFKEVTMGHPIVMGRKTWESLPKGALPGRRNIVISSNPDYQAPGAEVIANPESLAALVGEEEVFIIGGGSIFKQLMPLADRLYITEIDAEFTGDTYFPDIDLDEWKLISCREGEVNEKNPYSHRYLVYERKAETR